MAISVIQRAAKGDAATGSVALAFGSNVTAGSNLILIAAIESAPSTSLSLTGDTLKNDYRLVQTIQSPSNVMVYKVWVAHNIPTGGANTVTLTDGSNDATLHIFEVSGLSTSRCYDTYAWNKQASATSLTTTATPVTRIANELVIGFFINQNNGVLTWTLGGSYTNLTSQVTAFLNSASEELIISATGAQTATMTLGANSTIEECLAFTFADTPIPPTNFYNKIIRPHAFSPGLAR